MALLFSKVTIQCDFNEAEFMVRYMMEKRDVDIREMIIESSTATVENIASVVASVVYLKDEIIEG